MNLLSGTTYKGETMRIALAKPDYMARAAREKEESQTESVSQTNEENVPDKPQKAVSKSHRKLRKGVEGYESENWRLMTVKRFKNHDGTHVGRLLALYDHFLPLTACHMSCRAGEKTQRPHCQSFP